MNTPEPFYATTKQYALTEAAVSQLRTRLLAARRQYMLELRLPQQDISIVTVLEDEIDRLEHLLAHAVISDETGEAIDQLQSEAPAEEKPRSFLSRIRQRTAAGEGPSASPV